MSRRLLAAVAALLALAATAPAARADFGLVPGSFSAGSVDENGQPDLRAGGHPDRVNAGFQFNLTSDGGADGNVKDIVVDLPAGLVGDPNAAPKCGRVEVLLFSCPASTQIGVVHASLIGFGQNLDFPIYNTVPEAGDLAEFDFDIFVLTVRIVAGLRSDGDYGMRAELRNLTQSVPMSSGTIELWGVPADHQSGTAIPRRPFLTNATRCDQGPATTTLRVRSWQDPDAWQTVTSSASGPLTGCGNLAFDPHLAVSATKLAADTPSGMRVDLTVPQSDDPDGLATSQARALSVTLPRGFSLSPGVADGLVACTDEQLGVGTTHASACPEASKIGSVELATPLIAQPLPGDVYLGSQRPGDTYRLFVVVRGLGFTVKLRGSLQPDPRTGLLTAAFPDLPALPFSRLSLSFKDGPRAPIATPPACGAGAALAQITPYSGTPAIATNATVTIASGPGGAACPTVPPFAPSFFAGSLTAIGGGNSAFSATIGRADGDDLLDRVTLELPPGLSAQLATVPRCPAMPTTAGACPAASRVGSVTVDAGAGPNPLELVGDVYVTGPYRRAPFGLAFVVRALAGPFDLGTIVVPATLSIDPLDASLTVVTDQLPTMLAGIPLRLKTFGIDIDRAGFMFNPTSCRAQKVQAVIRGATSDPAQASSRYAVGGCRDLRFAPTMSLGLSGRGELRRGGHPGLTLGLRSRAGQANVRSARVELPLGLVLNSVTVSALCSREQARDGRCPRDSRVGTATVRTPLLSKPLTGDVNVVQPAGNGQPDLWMTIAGEGVRLSLQSTTVAPRGKPVRSEFVNLPDIPLNSFSLRLRGGKGGLLVTHGALCRHGKPRPMRFGASLQGQNGKHRSQRIRVRASASCKR